MSNDNTEIPFLPSFEELFPTEVLDEDTKMHKAQRCNEEIIQALKQYECTIVPQMSFGVDAQGYMRYNFNLQLVPTQHNQATV